MSPSALNQGGGFTASSDEVSSDDVPDFTLRRIARLQLMIAGKGSLLEIEEIDDDFRQIAKG